MSAVAAVVPPLDAETDDMDDENDKYHFRRKLDELVTKSKTMTDSIHKLDLFRFGAEYLPPLHDPTQMQIEALMMRGCGWGLVFGDAGVGKTFRVVHACRSVLRRQLTPGNELPQSLQHSEYDDEVDDDDEHKQSEQGRPRPPGGSLLYVDLRGSQSKGEVLSALARQLGVSEGGGVSGAEEAEQRVVRMLGGLMAGSVLVLDHVNVRLKCGAEPGDDKEMEGSVCSIVHTLLNHLSKSLSIVLVTHEDNGRGKVQYARSRLAHFLYRVFDDVRAAAHALSIDLDVESSVDHGLFVGTFPAPGSASDDVGAGSLGAGGLLEYGQGQLPGQRAQESGGEGGAGEGAFAQGCVAHVNVMPVDHATSTTLTALFAHKGHSDDSGGGPTGTDQRLAAVAALSRGYIWLIHLLVDLPESVLRSLPHAPVEATVAAASARGLASAVFSHPNRGMGFGEELVSTCLSPLLEMGGGCAFDEELGWALCKDVFLKREGLTPSQAQAQAPRTEADLRAAWRGCWGVLLRLGWLCEGPSSTYSIPSLAALTAHPMSVEDGCPVAVDRLYQYELYFTHVAVLAADANDRLKIATRLDGRQKGEGEAPSGHVWAELGRVPHGVHGRAQVTRQVDLLMPHLCRLFGAWIKRDKKDDVEKRRTVGFAVGGDVDAPSALVDGRDAVLDGDGDGDYSAMGGWTGTGTGSRSGAGTGAGAGAEEGVLPGPTAGADEDPAWWGADVVSLISEQRCRELAYCVAGRLAAVAALRLPVAQAVQLTRSIAEVRTHNTHPTALHFTPLHSTPLYIIPQSLLSPFLENIVTPQLTRAHVTTS